MPRGGEVRVREATESDRVALASLRIGISADPPWATPQQRVIVAVAEDEVVGMMVLGREPVKPVAGVCALEVGEFHVRAGSEHLQVGSALVAAATAEADDLGCQHILLATQGAGTRLSSRFGGGPRRRLTPVATLRRRLGLDAGRLDSPAARRRIVLRRAPSLTPRLSPEPPRGS